MTPAPGHDGAAPTAGAPAPAAEPAAELARLQRIIEVLMDRAEQWNGLNASDFGQFQTTIVLEEQVRQRTAELEQALRQNELLQERLEEQALHDSLTGLYNRRYLDAFFERELLRAQRAGSEISVVMADLDHFKRVNDRYGHPAGDAVLKAFAQLLSRHVRGSDLCCRYGGEEFLVLLADSARDAALLRVEQLRGALEALEIPWGEERLRITASFGMAMFPGDGTTRSSLIAAADQALYAAKNGGRNRVCCAAAGLG
jgi:diguanylate cyclase (GGDEF)-like protein